MNTHLVPSLCGQTTGRSFAESTMDRSDRCRKYMLDGLDRVTTDCPSSVSEHMALKIRHRLHATGYHALQAIDYEYHEGMVILRGRVSTYYMKQLAQSVLMADPMVQAIVNLIEVPENNHEVSHCKQ